MKSKDSNSKKSVSYQKKNGRGFFWYDNDKDLKACFLVTRVTSVHMHFLHSQLGNYELEKHSANMHASYNTRNKIGTEMDQTYLGDLLIL